MLDMGALQQASAGGWLHPPADCRPPNSQERAGLFAGCPVTDVEGSWLIKELCRVGYEKSG